MRVKLLTTAIISMIAVTLGGCQKSSPLETIVADHEKRLEINDQKWEAQNKEDIRTLELIGLLETKLADSGSETASEHQPTEPRQTASSYHYHLPAQPNPPAPAPRQLNPVIAAEADVAFMPYNKEIDYLRQLKSADALRQVQANAADRLPPLEAKVAEHAQAISQMDGKYATKADLEAVETRLSTRLSEKIESGFSSIKHQ